MSGEAASKIIGVKLQNDKIFVFTYRSLYEHGGDALSRQFAEVVKKHSRPVPAADILNSIAVDEELGVGGELFLFSFFIFELFSKVRISSK